MVNPKYVKLFKSRRIAAIIAGIGSLVIATMITIAFLGRSLGSFTTKMNTGNSLVRIDTSVKFENPTSYLSVGDLTSFTPETNSAFGDHDNIDNENTKTEDIAELLPGEAMRCFKYTFFIKNLGEKATTFDLNFNIDEMKKADNRDDGLDEILRVRFYENDAAKPNQHNFKTYAKMRKDQNFIDENGDVIKNEYIAQGAESGLAEMFEYENYTAGNSKVLSRKDVLLIPNQCIRYTTLIWLEGADPDCKGPVPENASIKLGIDIDVSEAEFEATE